jgi:hypothetical protein
VNFVSSSVCMHVLMCLYNDTVLLLCPKSVCWTLHNSQKMKVSFFRNIRIVKAGSENNEYRIFY